MPVSSPLEKGGYRGIFRSLTKPHNPLCYRGIFSSPPLRIFVLSVVLDLLKKTENNCSFDCLISSESFAHLLAQR